MHEQVDGRRDLLTDGSLEPDATAIAQDAPLGLTLWKVSGPLVLVKTRITGIYPGDTWSGPRVTWSREHCRGGSLTVSLSGDAQLLPNGNTVSTPSGASVHVAPNKVATLRVPLTSRGDTCSVVFNIAPTAVPSEVIPGSKDDRQLGVHFNAFAYRP